MVLDKAIKELKSMLIACTALHYHDTPDALKLGIEAMERWEAHRSECPACFMELLPGETEE